MHRLNYGEAYSTTSLTYYLKQHPQVYLPIKKEVHFFDLNFKKGLSWYKAYFPILSNKIPGEATPYYIFHPHVAKRIKQTIPNAKFIVLLREPVSRAFSQYRKETSEKHDNIKTFEEAFEAEKERVENEEKKMIKDEDYYSYAHQRYTYFSRGLYHKQIQNWLQYFNMEQFLFLKSEDFFSNPKKELKKVYEFLEIDEIYPDNLSIRNSGKEMLSNNQPMKEKYFEYYNDDAKQLRALLGKEFSWDK